MFFSRAIFGFLAFGALASFASPVPVDTTAVEEKKNLGDVLAIVGGLQDQVNAVLPQLDALADVPTATEAEVAGLLGQLDGAFETAAEALNALGSKVDTTVGGTVEEVANLVSEIYIHVSVTLEGVKGRRPEWLPWFLKYGVPAALTEVLVGLQTVVGGVLTLVGDLLRTVRGTLAELGLNIVIYICGIQI